MFRTFHTLICTIAWSVACLTAASTVYGAKDNQVVDATAAESFFSTLRAIFEIPWIRGGSVILISLIGTTLLVWLLFRFLRSISSRTSIALDDQIISLLRPPIYYTLLMIGITAGLEMMVLAGHLLQFTTRCLYSIGIMVWVIFFIRLATLLLNKVASLSGSYNFIQRRTVTLFDNVAKVLIFGGGIYGIFVIWDINLTAWIASAGIVGIAIGFAAKDTLSNLFAGVFIVADAPYRIGDYIVLDNGSRGKVTNIGLRSTRILTRDDIEVTVPNSIIGNTMIINQSGGPYEKMRIRLKVGVAYGTDVDRVKTILTDIAANEKQICASPAPRVRFRSFGPSSLDFELLFWVDNPELYGRVLDATNTTIYKKFIEEGIEIPYSKQDLYIKGLPEHFQTETGSARKNLNYNKD